jgi:hypothetical protein
VFSDGPDRTVTWRLEDAADYMDSA